MRSHHHTVAAFLLVTTVAWAALTAGVPAARAVTLSNDYELEIIADQVNQTVKFVFTAPEDPHGRHRNVRIVLYDDVLIGDSEQGRFETNIGIQRRTITGILPSDGTKLQKDDYYAELTVWEREVPGGGNGETIVDEEESNTVHITELGQSGECTVDMSQVRTDPETGTGTFQVDYTAPLQGMGIPPDKLLDVTTKLDRRPYGSFTHPVVNMPYPARFAGMNTPKVYTAEVTISYQGDELCVVTVDLDMTQEGDGTRDIPGTTSTEQTAFTWLSGECIHKMEELDLSAIPCVIANTISLLLSLVGIVATGIVVYGGFTIARAPDDDTRNKGKRIIKMALIGLVVVLFAFILVQIVLGGGIF